MHKTSISKVRAEQSGNSFRSLLRQEGDGIRRDVFLLLAPGQTESGRIQAGYSIIYPGCTTRGHAHEDREEVYFFRRGSGTMVVGEEESEVTAGDVFYVHPGPPHSTRNPTDFPLEYFWITITLDK